MVVQGLLKHILGSEHARQKTSLRIFAKDFQESTQKTPQLLCDFVPTIEWLLSNADSTFVRLGKLSPFSVLHEGDLHTYSQKVLSFVQALESAGVQPVFFVSSPSGFSQNELEARYEECKAISLKKLKEASTVHQICDGVVSLSEAKWRLTDFAALHVETVLRRAGTKVIYCTKGLVSEILGYCNIHEEACGVLSNNTDLVIPEGSRLFLPEMFQLENCDGENDGHSLEINCEFVTSATLASSLNVKESQLTDLAALCGNSYTKELTESLCPCASLKLPNSKVSTIAQWLNEQGKPLLECVELQDFFKQNPSYLDVVETSHSSYKSQSVDSIQQDQSRASIVELVQECVRKGTMSSHLLPITNGCYLRPVITEPATISSTCFVDLTLCLRKPLYSLLGVKRFQEHGRTLKTTFTTISDKSLDFITDSSQVSSLRQRPVADRLSFLFHIVSGESMEPQRLNNLLLAKDLVYSGAGDEELAKAVLVCSSLLFLTFSNTRSSPSPEFAFCELDAFLLTCLASLARVPVNHVNHRPTSRSIALSAWFTHVLQQLYLIGSFLGLTESFPSPGDIFSPLTFVTFHMASFTPFDEEEWSDEEGQINYRSIPDVSNCSPPLAAAAIVFNKLLDLKPVLALRAEFLNCDEEPDLERFVDLIAKSLEAVKTEKEIICESNLDDLDGDDVTDACSEKSKVNDGDSTRVGTPTRAGIDCTELFPSSTITFSADSSTVLPDFNLSSFSDASNASFPKCEELSSTQEHQASEEDIFFSLQGGLGDSTAFGQLDKEYCDNNTDTVESESPSLPGLVDNLSLTVRQHPQISKDTELEDPWTIESPEGPPVVTETVSSPKEHHISDGEFLKEIASMRTRVHKQLPKTRKGLAQLPVMAHKERILELVDTHSVVFIEGETGCGKSTKVPQFILDRALESNPPQPCKIMVTQPRRVAAMKLAERVASERRESIGKTVGFSIGGESHRTPDTALTYCTVGYLLQMLVHNPSLIRNYTHIILDEIHERSTDAEFAMLVVRKLALEVCGFKVILMSATMQGDLFVNYFQQTLPFAEIAPPYFVGSKRYHVETYFIDELVSLTDQRTSHWHDNQLKAATNLKRLISGRSKEDIRAAMRASPSVTKFAMSVSTELIVSQGEPGESILVFLPGIGEIVTYHESLVKEFQHRGIIDHFSVFILHSQVPFEDQRGAFESPPANKVHVILATNIAESSITLPKLRLVINFGVYRQLQYDSKRRLSCLVKTWCSHSSCSQRAGRAGRVFEGIAVHLFTRRFYDIILPEFNPPDISSAPLAKLVLQAKQIGSKLGMSSPSELLMLALEPPSLEQMESALEDLADLGAIVSHPGKTTKETAEITFLGNFSLSVPVDISLCRLILYGIFFGIPADAIVMAADMSLTQDVFSMPSRCVIKDEGQYYGAMLRGMESRFRYDGGQFSESLLVCRMFKEWIDCRNENIGDVPKQVLLRNFCRDRAVLPPRLLQLETTIAQIASRVLPSVPEDSQLHQCVSSLSKMARYTGPRYTEDPGVYAQFSNDPLLVKSLLTASFSHQMIVGVCGVESKVPRIQKCSQEELAHMEQVELNPTDSIVMRNIVQQDTSLLYDLVDRLLPGVPCDIQILSGTAYIHLPPMQSLSQRLSVTEVWKSFERESSVVSRKLSREFYIIWQYGERRAIWSVEGIEALFTRPVHPLSLVWQNLSTKNEIVGVSSYRNPSGFICDFSQQSAPFLAVATAMHGCEQKSFVSARKLTVLPSIEKSPAALLLTLAFQPLNAKCELLVDGAMKTITGFKINSQEIFFGRHQSITVEDIVRINILRRCISEALNDHNPTGALPMNKFANIGPLLGSVLSQMPIHSLLFSKTTHGTTVPVSPDVSSHWERQCLSECAQQETDSEDSEFELEDTEREEHSRGDREENLNLSTFRYYPIFACSLLDSLYYKEKEVELFLRNKEGPVSKQRDDASISSNQVMTVEKQSQEAFKLSALAKPFVPSPTRFDNRVLGDYSDSTESSDVAGSLPGSPTVKPKHTDADYGTNVDGIQVQESTPGLVNTPVHSIPHQQPTASAQLPMSYPFQPQQQTASAAFQMSFPQVPISFPFSPQQPSPPASTQLPVSFPPGFQGVPYQPFNVQGVVSNPESGTLFPAVSPLSGDPMSPPPDWHQDQVVRYCQHVSNTIWMQWRWNRLAMEKAMYSDQQTKSDIDGVRNTVSLETESLQSTGLNSHGEPDYQNGPATAIAVTSDDSHLSQSPSKSITEVDKQDFHKSQNELSYSQESNLSQNPPRSPSPQKGDDFQLSQASPESQSWVPSEIYSPPSPLSQQVSLSQLKTNQKQDRSVSPSLDLEQRSQGSLESQEKSQGSEIQESDALKTTVPIQDPSTIPLPPSPEPQDESERSPGSVIPTHNDEQTNSDEMSHTNHAVFKPSSPPLKPSCFSSHLHPTVKYQTPSPRKVEKFSSTEQGHSDVGVSLMHSFKQPLTGAEQMCPQTGILVRSPLGVQVCSLPGTQIQYPSGLQVMSPPGVQIHSVSSPWSGRVLSEGTINSKVVSRPLSCTNNSQGRQALSPKRAQHVPTQGFSPPGSQGVRQGPPLLPSPNTVPQYSQSFQHQSHSLPLIGQHNAQLIYAAPGAQGQKTFVRDIPPPSARHRLQQSRHPPNVRRHVGPVHRHTPPETFLYPPFGAPVHRPPTHPLPSKRRKPHFQPPTGSYVSRYSQPTCLPNTIPSFLMTQKSRNQERMDSRDAQNMPSNSLLQTMAYLNEKKEMSATHTTTGKSQRKLKQPKPLHEEHGIPDRELIVYFSQILRKYRGNTELSELCGGYYRQFLEWQQVRSNTVGFLDPQFFTVKYPGVFKVCASSGMCTVTLIDQTKPQRNLELERVQKAMKTGVYSSTLPQSEETLKEEASVNGHTRSIKEPTSTRKVMLSEPSKEGNSVKDTTSGGVPPKQRLDSTEMANNIEHFSASNTIVSSLRTEPGLTSSTSNEEIDREHSFTAGGCQPTLDDEEIGREHSVTTSGCQPPQQSRIDITEVTNDFSGSTEHVADVSPPQADTGPTTSTNSEEIDDKHSVTASSQQRMATTEVTDYFMLLSESNADVSVPQPEYEHSQSLQSDDLAPQSNLTPEAIVPDLTEVLTKPVEKAQEIENVKEPISSNRCTNAASAVVAFSQGSSPTSIPLTSSSLNSFDEDCWIENNTPMFSPTKPQTLDDEQVPSNVDDIWSDGNSPISLSQDMQRSSRSETSEERESKSSTRQSAGRPPPLKYTGDASGWETLDVRVGNRSPLNVTETDGENKRESSHEAQKTESDCLVETAGHVGKGSTKKDTGEVSSKKGGCHDTRQKKLSVGKVDKDEDEPGSFSHFLSFTEREMLHSTTNKVFFFGICGKYRKTYKLSRERCWFEVEDVQSENYRIQKSKHGGCYLVKKGGGSPAPSECSDWSESSEVKPEKGRHDGSYIRNRQRQGHAYKGKRSNRGDHRRDDRPKNSIKTKNQDK